MPRRFRTLRPPSLYAGLVAVLLVTATPAWAQFGGGGAGRPMGPGQQPGAGIPTGPEGQPEQAAEAAPETQGQEQALTPLPAWPGQEKKTVQFFQLNGYMRGRAYFFHTLNMGVGITNTPPPNPPFYVPFSESPTSNAGRVGCSGRNNNNGCQSSDIASADMRLRLDPTINIGDQVRVRATADIFDNLVLGSTPEGYFINGLQPAANVPIAAFSKGQAPVVQGVNSLSSSIVVKRAWAEVKTPIGELRFGRMPIAHVLPDQYIGHWGSGMYFNSGDCLDCDYGTVVDRVLFTSKLFNHYLTLMWDFGATGPTTALYNPNFTSGPTYSADPLVNLQEWGLVIGRQDKPEEIKERIDHGERVVNYGGFFVYRRQDFDQKDNINFNTPQTSTTTDFVPLKLGALGGVTPQELALNTVPRHFWSFTPDLWFRFNYKKLQIEAEAMMIVGQIGSNETAVANANMASNQYTRADPSKSLLILQFGGTFRIDYKLLRDALSIGLEVGAASGDSSEDPSGNLNFRTAQIIRPQTQGSITNFQFDPDYHVDLILFRRILGTVSNATYFKPHASYAILDNLSARADAILSLANQPVGYPGNVVPMGLELDASLLYHNDEERFFASIAYGVLFPFDALKYPASIYGANFGGQTAQTVSGNLAVKF